MIVVFPAAALLAAALLFLVEPMVARMILPVLGGSPAVWITAVAFFQVVLLVGYAYAHVTTRYLRGRGRAAAHLLLIVAVVPLLPIALPPGWERPTGSPYLWEVALLTVVVGVPFLALASLSPVLQRWYGEQGTASAENPYTLFAYSNVGSFVGLLAYPLLVEPALGLEDQTQWWAVAYGVLAVLVATALASGLRRSDPTTPVLRSREPSAPPTWKRRLWWLTCAFIPSSLLLGGTTFVTSQVGSIPLFWVLPLAAYLATFVVAFRGGDAAVVPAASRWLVVVALAVFATWSVGVDEPFWVVLLLHLAVVFVGGLVGHGRLYESRPPVDHLTDFYLVVALGGALGGAFTAFVAPLIFRWAVEYPLMIVAAAALMVMGRAESASRRQFLPALLAPAVALVVDRLVEGGTGAAEGPVLLLAVGVPALVLISARRAAVFALGLGLLFAVHPPVEQSVDARERTFYGIHTVRTVDGERALFHGSTLHGTQFLDGRAADPSSYFSRAGPLGDVMATSGGERSIGAVGLGVGTLAAYGEPGDEIVFFEIDPVVVDLARDSRLFTYLGGSPASIRYVVGDGRLGVAAEPAGSFDLLVLDAFTADAIPVHLLTADAFAVYLQRLAPGGVITLHVSNRHFDLVPVVAAVADHLDAALLVREDEGGQGRVGSTWVAVAAEPSDLAGLRSRAGWEEPPADGRPRLWTDDYANPLAVLRWLRG